MTCLANIVKKIKNNHFTLNIGSRSAFFSKVGSGAIFFPVIRSAFPRKVPKENLTALWRNVCHQDALTEYEKRLKCKSYPKDYKDSMKNVSIKARDGPDRIPMFRAVYRVSGRIIRLNIWKFWMQKLWTLYFCNVQGGYYY